MKKLQCNDGETGEGTWLYNHRNNVFANKIRRQQRSQKLPTHYVLNNHAQNPNKNNSQKNFHTFPRIYLIFPHFKIPSPHFTYHISAPVPGNTRFPPLFEFPSFHFTSVTTFITLFLKVLGLEGKFPEQFIRSLFQSWMVLFSKGIFPDIPPMSPVPKYPVMVDPAQMVWPL